MLNLYHTINNHIKEALERAFPSVSSEAEKAGISLDPQLVKASKPEFGDFQANGAMQLAKLLKQQPRAIAFSIVEQLKTNKNFIELCKEPEIAGPGFINITLKNDCLINEIQNRLNDNRLGVAKVEVKSGERKTPTVIVDFSSPNIAKEMHVGHLRSTIIGDSLARILEFRGYKVLRLNHIGDWGTQFGMLITHLKDVAPEALKHANALDLGDLVVFYREAKKRFDNDNAFQEASRNEVVKLQGGEALSVKAWQLLCAQSRQEFQKIYDRLDIRLKERGESFYNPYLEGVVEELNNLGLVVKDQGAQCIFLDTINRQSEPQAPVIVQKSDGGFNYATTDLAAIQYRFNNPPHGDGADRIIYVTDSGQANHFEGVFQIAKNANWIPENAKLEHVPFGLVQGEDGKKLKTRSGQTIRLRDLLDEAIERAKSDLTNRLQSEDRNETDAFIEEVATTVGIAAVKYADLSQNRISNYQFSFNRMLNLQGNTAPYLLYSVVRIAGIARKGGFIENEITELKFETKQEWSLIRALLKFDEIIIEVENELLPNRLCTYLFELSQVFNRFYDQVPVLKAREPFRKSRIALCKLTADTLKLGMGLLGIRTLERM